MHLTNGMTCEATQELVGRRTTGVMERFTLRPNQKRSRLGCAESWAARVRC